MSDPTTPLLSCADCGSRACNGKGGVYPPFCLTTHLDPAVLADALSKYTGSDAALAQASALVEHEGYGQLTRVQEVMLLADKMGYHRIGIATCVGLLRETATLTRILRYHGFEVYAVCCKCGAVNKTEIGIDPECLKRGPNMCNPILQAEILNNAKTDLNLVVGLCAGHDSLFYKYTEGYCVTMVVKDRVTMHNPAAVLYGADSYYKTKLFPPKD